MHPDQALVSHNLSVLDGWSIVRRDVGRLVSESGQFVIHDVIENLDVDEYSVFGFTCDVHLDVVAIEARDELGAGKQAISIGTAVGDWRRPGDWRLLPPHVPHPRGSNSLMVSGRSGILAVFPAEAEEWFRDLDTDPDYIDGIWDLLGGSMAKMVGGACYVGAEAGSYACWGRFAPTGEMIAIYVDLDMLTEEEE